MAEQQKYPTREQIAEAIAWEIGGVDPDRWRLPLWRTGLDAEWTGDVRRAADAVLALFPQPTPSAEACVNESGQGDECAACAASTAPPSGADMAPGTTFRARYLNEARHGKGEHMFFVTAWTGGNPICVGTRGERRSFEAIDPSTIRDVTPPPTTPETTP